MTGPKGFFRVPSCSMWWAVSAVANVKAEKSVGDDSVDCFVTMFSPIALWLIGKSANPTDLTDC